VVVVVVVSGGGGGVNTVQCMFVEGAEWGFCRVRTCAMLSWGVKDNVWVEGMEVKT
jgi:cell division GTPase FtsZ